MVAAGAADEGEAVIIAQLAAVRQQLTQILSQLEVEDVGQG